MDVTLPHPSKKKTTEVPYAHQSNYIEPNLPPYENIELNKPRMDTPLLAPIRMTTSTDSSSNNSEFISIPSPPTPHTQHINLSPIISGVKVVEGQRTIFLSKLDPTTNALDIKNYIKAKVGNLDQVLVEKMLHRNFSKYSSFKITCSDSLFYLLNSMSFWPTGIIMHEFKNRNFNKQSCHFPQQPTKYAYASTTTKTTNLLSEY